MVASTLARLLLGVCLLFFFVVGFFVGGVGLHDPDTCWLLALGRYMFEHLSLPPTDPFSWTFELIQRGELVRIVDPSGDPSAGVRETVAGPRQFIMYQWLAELIFYAAYKVAKLPGVLMFASLVLLNSFLLVPIRSAVKCGSPFAVAIVAALLAVVAGSFHFLVRPEIFSYLLLVLLLWFLASIEPPGSALAPIEDNGRLSPWMAIAFALLLMTLWANLHTGFICGVVVLFARPVLHLLEWIIWEKRHYPKVDVVAWGGKAFLLAVAGTLITPWGIRLWQYIPHLFFLPVNDRIVELRPLSVRDFHEYTYYPFLVIAFISIVVQLLAARSRVVPRAASGRAHWNQLYGPISVIGWLIAGFSCRRLIPFAALVLLAEALPVLAVIAAGNTPQMLRDIERKLRSMVDPTSLMWFVTAAILCLFGCYLVTSRVVPPEMPQSSKVFPAPANAIKFIRDNPLPGRLFNDPQYGDTLIWHLQPAPKVFIDTRFDMYGADLVRQYETIVGCKTGWRELIDRYKIDSVFLPIKAPLIEELTRVPGWKEIYRDEVAAIIVRER